MTHDPAVDSSNGYQAIAEEFIAIRSAIGAETVRRWAASLPKGAHVLDIGCGHGVPISAALSAEGVTLYAVDASPTMVAAYSTRFPEALVQCSPVEDFDFFGHCFDAAVAWGLMFLLAPDVQSRIITSIASRLKPGGHFLFTSPREACTWRDNLTGRTSVSLGADAYRYHIERSGMKISGHSKDEGQNFYYFVQKPESDSEGQK